MTGERRPVSGTDCIVLVGVEAVGHHGVLDLEREQGQPFVVDVVLELDLAPAGRSDDLLETVSYAEVATDVVARISGPAVDLIERLAELVADDALARPLVEAVEVTVHKPQAPVGQPFTDVAVHVRRERGVPVVVALGANLGDARATLAAAVAEIGALPGVRVRRVSPLVETDPVGGPEQPVYLNAVLLADTTRDPADLLRALLAVEDRHGRTRDVRWGARTLDLDLVQVGRPGTAGEVRLDTPDLTLPHPRAHERPFVLVPWAAADDAASVRDGGGGIRRVRELLAGLAGPDDGTHLTDDTAHPDPEGPGVRPGPDWSPSW